MKMTQSITNTTPRPQTVSLARKAAEEGIVLLKNEDNILPLKANSPVSIFGRCQINTFSGGYGSGVGPSADYPPINLIQGFDNNPVLSYNEELAKLYADWVAENPITFGGWGTWPASYPEMPLTEETVSDARAVSDTAVVIIGRAAGEDRELQLKKSEIFLSDDELDMLSKVNARFENIIILMNAGNVLDMSWIADYKHIKGVLYVWQGGLENGNAIADVLSGDVSPSGKLAATIAKSFYDYPSSDTFGVIDGDSLHEIYKEDIYVGYRYFETFAKDKVLYPFGYGLSYTNFDISAAYEIKDGNIVISATVKNIGNTCSGKEVVQIYYSAPQGGLGKPTVELAAYAKTNEIAPGASQTLTITFPVKNMASYDDSGKSGHKSAWVMEAGEYKLLVGNSCRDLTQIGTYNVTETVVTEQLSEASAPTAEFNRIIPIVGEDGSITEGCEPTPTAEVDIAERVLKNLPNAVEMTEDKGITLMDVYNGNNTMDEFIAQLSAEELAVLTRGNGYQGYEKVEAESNGGAFGGISDSLLAKGIPAVSTRGTPAGIGAGGKRTKIPIATMLACTFNDNLVEELYYYVGLEGLDAKLDSHLAPSMNIHRNPLCGRNFEYFSEDPVLTGQMAAAAVIGAQKTGISSCPKHYALNNQEASRRGSDSIASERAQREIYLKGFEICVKASNPDNIMASYNKVNGVYSHYNYDLATTILRDEWGWDGVLMTDWWLMKDSSDKLDVSNDAWRIRAQVDLNMPGAKPGLVTQDSAVKNDIAANVGDSLVLAAYNKWVEAGKPTDRLAGLTLGEIQRCARNVLTYIMQSRVFRLQNGLELDLKEPTGYEYFTVEGILEETEPQLTSLTIEGMKGFNAFSPSIRRYKVFIRDMTKLPNVYATGNDGDIVTVKQATSSDPSASVIVNNNGGKNVYRVVFTNEAGLNPVVDKPVYARVSDIKLNGISLASFYPTIYNYKIVGSADSTEIKADLPDGVIAKVIKDTKTQGIIIRAESNHQATEYLLSFVSKQSMTSESDYFDCDEIRSIRSVTVSPSEKTTILAADDAWYLSGSLSVANEGSDTYVTDTDGGLYAIYSIAVQKSGYYKLNPTYAVLDTSSGGAMLELDIELDGEQIANYRPGGNTGGWTRWQTVSPATVWLPEGIHKLRFVWGSSANLKNIIIEPDITVA